MYNEYLNSQEVVNNEKIIFFFLIQLLKMGGGGGGAICQHTLEAVEEPWRRPVTSYKNYDPSE